MKLSQLLTAIFVAFLGRLAVAKDCECYRAEVDTVCSLKIDDGSCIWEWTRSTVAYPDYCDQSNEKWKQTLCKGYMVLVKTGDDGTDGSVSVEIAGEHGTSGFRYLVRHGNDFEVGDSRVYFVYSPRNLGRVQRITFHHQTCMHYWEFSSRDWYLAYAVVSDWGDAVELPNKYCGEYIMSGIPWGLKHRQATKYCFDTYPSESPTFVYQENPCKQYNCFEGLCNDGEETCHDRMLDSEGKHDSKIPKGLEC